MQRSLRPAFAASVLVLLLIPLTSPAENVLATSPPAQFDDPSLFISTQELEDLVREDLDVRVIDLRPTEKYEAGRLPFALSLPAAAVLDPTSRIAGARLSDGELATIFGLLGIGPDNFVVLYDDVGGHFAARVLWNHTATTFTGFILCRQKSTTWWPSYTLPARWSRSTTS